MPDDTATSPLTPIVEGFGRTTTVQCVGVHEFHFQLSLVMFCMPLRIALQRRGEASQNVVIQEPYFSFSLQFRCHSHFVLARLLVPGSSLVWAPIWESGRDFKQAGRNLNDTQSSAVESSHPQSRKPASGHVLQISPTQMDSD